MSKLLIYVVSFNRKSYTQGTIMCLQDNIPEDSQIIVCDNGSTDGTRKWLKENQDKYSLGLIFPDDNLRVGGAWTLLTQYYKEDDFDFILLLDNDCWMLPNPTWFEDCLSIFNLDKNIGSLGLEIRPKPGYYSTNYTLDPNYKDRKQYKEFEYYDTVYYAGLRLDKFKLWYNTMKKWPHKFIGDKIGRHYNSLSQRTIQFVPGCAVDISQYDISNQEHQKYYEEFYSKERNVKYMDWLNNFTSPIQKPDDYITSTFGEKFLNLIK